MNSSNLRDARGVLRKRLAPLGRIAIGSSLLLMVFGAPAAYGQFVSGDVIVNAIGLQNGGPIHNNAIDYILRFGCPQCGEGIGSPENRGRQSIRTGFLYQIHQ